MPRLPVPYARPFSGGKFIHIYYNSLRLCYQEVLVLISTWLTITCSIYVGSTTAFNAFVGSYVLMSSSSYLAAVLPHLLTGRKNITYGPFRLKSWLGFAMNFVACGYMLTWFVIYSFPVALPVNAQNMNYACLIWGGLTIFVAVWWVMGAHKNYEGPATTGGVSQVDLVRRASMEARKRSSQA